MQLRQRQKRINGDGRGIGSFFELRYSAWLVNRSLPVSQAAPTSRSSASDSATAASAPRSATYTKSQELHQTGEELQVA
jgi:hypothetical protein